MLYKLTSRKEAVSLELWEENCHVSSVSEDSQRSYDGFLLCFNPVCVDLKLYVSV